MNSKVFFQNYIDNLPLRPIVNFVGSPIYNLSRYLNDLLTHAFDKDMYHVKDACGKCFTRTKIPEGYILVTLDAVSLFSNLPTDLVSRIVKEKWTCI